MPPRLGQSTGSGQDKPLSVSGKKKCSHCKEELGKLMDPDINPCNLILMKIANYCNCIIGYFTKVGKKISKVCVFGRFKEGEFAPKILVSEKNPFTHKFLYIKAFI